MIEAITCGAVVFDDHQRPGAGWASVGGEQAFRIRGTGDLASDVFWWTNLEYTAFVSYSISNPKLKRTTYLRPNMTQLHQELGLVTVRMPPARIAEITAEIFSRVLRLAQERYDFDYPSEDTFSGDLYRILVDADTSITPEIDNALKQSYQTWYECENKPPQGAKTITFRRPRIQHALDVLSTPVPGEQWEFVDGSSMVAEDKRVDWLINQPRPVLARVSVKSVQFNVAKIISFGAGAQEPRNWMSHPELLMMSKFANVKVHSAFIANDYAPQNVFKPLYTGGSFGSLSVSNGILAENYWVAMSIASTLKRFQRERHIIHSPRAVWYSAADRFYTMLPAMMMDGSGFCVRGYGRGMVTVAVQRGMLADARACAAYAGLNAPLYVHEDIAVQSALAG